jgi:hypothetical protein
VFVVFRSVTVVATGKAKGIASAQWHCASNVLFLNEFDLRLKQKRAHATHSNFGLSHMLLHVSSSTQSQSQTAVEKLYCTLYSDSDERNITHLISHRAVL